MNRNRPGRHRSLRVTAILLLTTTLGFQLGSSSAAAQSNRRSAVVQAVESARPSVVNIHGHKTVPATDQYATDAKKRVNGMGTGVVVDPRGYVLTNYHVVEGVRRIQVTLGNGARFVARLIAHDPATDLAIIKIPVQQRMPVVRVGSSRDIMTGETVIAVGNAYGYEHTVTVGIVSAQHRNVQVNDTQSYNDLIQTDASINPGNSGGPLLNIDGNMIGINVAVRVGAQGIGFAIPVNQAMQVAARLMSAERLSGVWHGVIHEDTFLNDKPAIVVRNVQQGSPAYRAGLRRGDVIRQVAGKTVGRGLDFECAFIGSQVGDSIDCSVDRKDEPVKLKLAISEAPNPKTKKALASTQIKDPVWKALGVRLTKLSIEETKERTDKFRGGLLVTSLDEKGLAAGEGIQVNDVLVGMHVWETTALDNVDYVLEDADLSGIDKIPFYILRGKKTFAGEFSVSKLR